MKAKVLWMTLAAVLCAAPAAYSLDCSNTCSDALDFGLEAAVAVNTDPAQGSTCDGYEVPDDEHPGQTKCVCGCAVDEPGPGEPAYVPPRPSSAGYVSLTYSYNDPQKQDLIGWGLYPDPHACADPPFQPLFTTTETPTFPLRDFERYDPDTNPDGYNWFYPYWSPDGKYVVIGDSLNGGELSPLLVRQTLFKVGDGADKGWKLENYLKGFSNMLTYIGPESEGTAYVYFQSHGYYRLKLNLNLQEVDGGAKVVTFEQGFFEQLMIRPLNGTIADSHVLFLPDASTGVWEPRYSVHLRTWCTVPPPPLPAPQPCETGIYLMDLDTCVADPPAGYRFRCKTVKLFERQTSAKVPTNPVLSTSGKFVSFHMDNEELFENSPLLLMKNPLHPDFADVLATCDASGDKDGYVNAIDCKGLLKTGESYDFPGKCPSYGCCDDSSFHCSYCTALGAYEDACGASVEPDVGRNDTVFYIDGGREHCGIMELSKEGEANYHRDFASWKVELSQDGEFVGVPGYPRRVVVSDKPEFGEHRTALFRPHSQQLLVDPAIERCAPCTDDPDCDDGNPCTDDDCVGTAPNTVCVYANNTDPCDDAYTCTMNDTCSGGACGGVPLDADDDGYISDQCGGSDCLDDPSLNPTDPASLDCDPDNRPDCGHCECAESDRNLGCGKFCARCAKCNNPGVQENPDDCWDNNCNCEGGSLEGEDPPCSDSCDDPCGTLVVRGPLTPVQLALNMALYLAPLMMIPAIRRRSRGQRTGSPGPR